MNISSEFLIIENNKAVIKTLEKQVDTYECLIDFKQLIKRLEKDEVLSRLSSKKIGDKINVIEFFSKEYKEPNIPISINFYDIHFELQQGNVNSAQEILYDSYEEKEVSFNQFNRELQEIFLNKFLNNAINEIDSKYNYFENEELEKFINNKLNEKNIAFCRNYRPNGFNKDYFEYKDLKVLHHSNFDYGNASFSVLQIWFLGESKIIKTNCLTFDNFSHILLYKKNFSLENVQVELNEYINNPQEYKKAFLKNNINLLKDLLQKEQDIIPILENTIIPELEDRVKKLDKTSDNYNLEVKILDKYKIEKERSKTISFSAEAYSVNERKTRIEFLKAEINRLIKQYKSDEEFLNFV